MPTWALVKGVREKKNNIWYRRKGENWWKDEKKKRDSLCAYMAQMSGGNCAGGLFCRHLPACSTILFFPAALILRSAQHNPDRYITKGPTRVTFNFRLPFPVWCTSWDDGIFMKLSIISAWFLKIQASIIWLCDKESCSWTPHVHHIAGMDKSRKWPSGPFLATAITYSSSFRLFSKRLWLFQPPVQHSPSGRKVGAWLPTHC